MNNVPTIIAIFIVLFWIHYKLYETTLGVIVAEACFELLFGFLLGTSIYDTGASVTISTGKMQQLHYTARLFYLLLFYYIKLDQRS